MLRCQNPECAAVVDISPLPLDYEATLRGLVRTAAGVPSPTEVLSPTTTTTTTTTTSGSDTVSAIAVDWAALKAAQDRGDGIDFVHRVAAAFSRVVGVDLPLCDACMESAVKQATSVRDAAADAKDAAVECLARIKPAGVEGEVSVVGDGGGSVDEVGVNAGLWLEEALLTREIEHLAAQLAFPPSHMAHLWAVLKGGDSDDGGADGGSPTSPLHLVAATLSPTATTVPSNSALAPHAGGDDAFNLLAVSIDTPASVAEGRTALTAATTCTLTMHDGRTWTLPLSPAHKRRVQAHWAILVGDGGTPSRGAMFLPPPGMPLPWALARIRSASLMMDTLEEEAWCVYRRVSGRLLQQRDVMYRLLTQDVTARDLVGRLRYLHVITDCFFIWHEGPYATINGCRLGRVPGQPVEWWEVEAGLGHVAMLLSMLAERVGYAFRQYVIVPRGSYSTIAPVGDERESWELRYSASTFWGVSVKFNNALKGLLTSLGELGTFAQAQDRSFFWPYPVSPGGDKVGDLPITISGRGDEPLVRWTQALKCMLINLKWLMAWAFRLPDRG